VSRALSCSHCGGPVGYGDPACRWCSSPLSWPQVPRLQRGAPRCVVDLRTAPLPGPVSTLSSVPCEGGVEIAVEAKQMVSGHTEDGLTEVAVGLTGAALDRNGAFGVLARRSSTGSVACAYALTVRPGLRTWAMSALLWGSQGTTRGKTEVRVLRPPTFHEAVQGVGAWNEVELRAADHLLEVRVNDVVLATLVDGVFGFGSPGWRVLGLGGPSRVQLHRFTVHDLI